MWTSKSHSILTVLQLLTCSLKANHDEKAVIVRTYQMNQVKPVV